MTAVVRLDELRRIDVAGVHWRPLRMELGVSGFGTNAYSADAGEQLIEEHTEQGTGQQEMYVLIRGRARFTLGDEQSEVGPASVVFFDDPAVRRGAVALEDGTLALAVGGLPGAIGGVSAWEHRFAGAAEEDPARGYEVAAVALADHPDDPNLHYDLACFAAQAGDRDKALEHWRRAVALKPEARRWAAEDRDLDPIRDALDA